MASDGGTFNYGDAAFHGSTGSLHLKELIVGIAAAPGGTGCRSVASNGGVFAFGRAATFFGSGTRLVAQACQGDSADVRRQWLLDRKC